MPKQPKPPAASASYQYRIVEINVKYQDLARYTIEQSIGGVLEANAIDPRILDLRQELRAEVMKLIDTQLTAHQKKILTMTFSGQTQSEIAKELGITQSAVHKAVHGNLDFVNLNKYGEAKRYGGAVRKLQKLSANSEIIQGILKQIEDIKNEDSNET